MIRRVVSLILLIWSLGFLWFAVALPQPAELEQADAIVVPTGSGGRIGRGLDMLAEGAADKMLVTGVDPQVRPAEFQAEYGVSDDLMECCVTLGFAALDTRGNARETAQWVEGSDTKSIRLVTADWHMRRAALELADQLPSDVTITRDAVRSEVSFSTLVVEYHKFITVWLLQAFG